MGKEIFKLKRDRSDSFVSMADRFSKEMDASVVAAVGNQVGDIQTILYVFERYYIRTENVASLTVLFTNDGQQILADVIATGAGGGVLNISWGANASFAKIAVDILEKQGFRVLEEGNKISPTFGIWGLS